MKKTLLLVVGGLAAAVLWRASRPDAPPPPPAQSSETPAPDLAVRAALANVRGDLDRLEARTATLAAAAPAPEATPARAASPAPSPEEQRAAYATRLAAALAAEPFDAGWARAAEAQVRAQIAARPADGVSVASIECRTTLCRLQLEAESTDARDEGLRAVPRWVPWDFDGFYQPTDGDPRRVTLYVTRAEHPLAIGSDE